MALPCYTITGKMNTNRLQLKQIGINYRIFWDPLHRYAVLGQQGRSDEAYQEIIKLKLLKSDFEEKASYLISHSVKEIELVEHIISGLRNAGITV